MNTSIPRISVILLCFLLGLATQARSMDTSLTIVYSSNSYGVIAPCPS
jgi:hypothetical protein